MHVDVLVHILDVLRYQVVERDQRRHELGDLLILDYNVLHVFVDVPQVHDQPLLVRPRPADKCREHARRGPPLILAERTDEARRHPPLQLLRHEGTILCDGGIWAASPPRETPWR